MSNTLKEKQAKIDAAYDVYKKRKQSNVKNASSDIAKRIDAEIDSFQRNQNTLSAGSLKGALEASRENTVNISKLKQEVEAHKNYFDEDTYNTFIKKLNQLSNGYNSIYGKTEEGQKGWQKYLADEEAAKNVLKHDLNNDGKEAWWEKALGYLGGSGGGVVDTTLPTAEVTQSIHDLRADQRYRRPRDNWSEDQKNTFGYLYMTSPEKAYKYAETTNNKIDAGAEEDALKKISESATSGFWAGAGHTLGAIATAPMGLADYLNDLAMANAGRDIAPDGQVSPFEYSQAVTGGISSNLNEKGGVLDESIPIIGGKGWGDVYGLGTSIAQSMASAYTLGGGGTLVSYFGQGAAAGVDDALSRGASDEQAVLYGTSLGVFEGLAEKVGVDNLFKLGSSSTVKGTIKNILKQAGAEGSEEFLTSFFSNIADNAIMQGKSNFNYLVAKYMAQGMSESDAKKKAWMDTVGGIAYDTIAGAASGSVSGGIHTSIATMANNKQAKNLYGNGAELVTEALDIDPDNAYAQKMQANLDNGKNLSGGQINRLVESNEQALKAQDTAKMKSAVEARLTELGETGDISKLADVIVKAQSGETLTRSERSLLVNSKYGRRVSTELNPQSIESGEYTSKWAEGIGTERINTEAYNKGPNALATEQAGVAVGEGKASVTENTSTKEIASEGKISASVAKATMTDSDGNTVDVKPQRFASTESGETGIELENGDVVKFADVDFGESGIGLVYQAAMDRLESGNFSMDTANVFVRGYNEASGQNVGEYINGWISSYNFGAMKNPPSLSVLSANPKTSQLTAEQRETAYNFGKALGNEKKQEKIDSTVSKNADKNASKGKKKGKLHNTLKPTNETQRASLKALGVLAEALNIDIYTFESPTDAKGRRLGENGSYDPVTKTLRIDLYAGADGKGTMLFTAAHELTHHIRETLPEKFNVFADFLFEQYGEKGISVSKLIAKKKAFLEEKGRITPDMTEEQAYDLAYEEVVADACESFLADGEAVAKIAELKAKDKTLWQTIKDFLTKLVARIKSAYEGLSPDSIEGRLVAEMLDSAEKLKAMWTEMLVEASENFSSVEKTLAENGIAVNSDTESATLMSVRYVLTDEQRKKVSSALATRFGVTPKEAMDWLKAETSMASLILNPKYSQYLDYTADPDEVAIKQNSDYPQGTVDFSPICAKRREFTSVMNNILRLFPNHVFAATDLAKIRTIMQEEGMTIPCGICYVEDRRQLDTIVAQNFIDSLKLYREGSKIRPDGKPFNTNQLKGLSLTDGDSYTPSVYELVSLEGLNVLKAKNPNMAEAWVKFNNARGMQSVRLLANEAEYKRQILKYSKTTVKSKNDKGGLRVYSFSDAEMFHLIDIIQVITDSATVGLSLQGYTKVNEYARAVKDTGEKLNRSLIPKGELGYHIEDGKVVLDYDTVEGIDIYHPDFFDNKDNPNVGNITIGVSDVQIRAAMVSDFVDQIIPFHTGQSEEVLGEKGIDTWTNYKDFQTEKDIATGKVSDHQINIYTEVLQVLEKEGTPITKRTFVEKFLQVCKENGLTPRFSQFLNTNEKGEYVYTEGYHKMLVDFKTFAQTEVGEYLPQKPVKPIFDDEYITKILKNHVKSQKVKDAELAKSMPRVIERITNEIVKPSETKHSDRVTDKDTAYMDAVNRGDMATAQRMVDEVAKEAGYTIKGNHGTLSFFTIFDRSFGNPEGDWGKGFYFTNNEEDSETNYASADGADLQVKIEKYAQQLGWTEEYADLDYDELIEVARKELTKGEPRVIKAYLKMDNPVIVGGQNETYFDFTEDYNEETEEYGEPSGKLVEFVEALSSILEEYEANGAIDADNINVYELFQDGDGYTASQLEKAASELLENVMDENGDYASKEIIRAALEAIGFDGIVDNTVAGKFGDRSGRRNGGMVGVTLDTTHYVAFKSSQIKQSDPVTYDDNGKVIPLSKRFNTKNNDIRYSDRDTNGNTLSEVQKSFFADSKVRDTDGNLLVAYHGTPNEMFYEFDPSRHKSTTGTAAWGKGFYFSDEKSSYYWNGEVGAKNSIECYLDIKKPFYVGNGEQVPQDLRDYIEATDAYKGSSEYRKKYLGESATRWYDFLRFTVLNDGDANEILKALGYDGIIVGDNVELVIFDSNQAKLTTNKTPTSNPDIRYSDRVLMGSLFSGGGTLEAGLVYQMLDKEFAVEYNEKIASAYTDNHGKEHMFVGDVRDFNSKKKQNVFYLHASPVCKNFSPASHSGGETTLDITTAQATARVLEEQMPQAFTVENVKRYIGSEAYNIIADKLNELGYTWDVDVYKASDYGNATKRERMIIRAVRDGQLPAKPQKASNITSWGEATRDLWETDLIPSYLVKSKIEAIRNTPKLKGLKLTKLDKPLLIYDTTKSKTINFAWADELAPTLTTKCGDARIIMPDGRVYAPTPKFMGRIQGLPDDYKYPKSTTRAFTIIGNGIPTQLTKAVMGGVLDSAYEQTHNGKVLYSDRASYAPTFYSHMGKVIDDIKLEKMGRESILNHLKNRGVKAEEIKWSGIEAFLEGKKSVTKAELQEFVAGSQLQIEEKLGGGGASVTLERSRYGDDSWDVMRGGEILDTYSWNEDSGLYESDETGGGFSTKERVLEYFKEKYGSGDTRWGQYKLDGGTNYRELVFKLPNSTHTNQAMRTHWGQDAEGILVHARIQDFEVNGKKMLFIEEIQSDWHNEGAQDGYVDSKEEARIEGLKAKADEAFFKVEDYSVAATGVAGEWEVIEKTPRGVKLLRDYREAQAEYDNAMNEFVKRIPDAPFRDTYHEYVLKRLIRMAAEEGYDSIGWTPADIQDKRWSDGQYHEEGKGKSGNLKGYTIEYDQDMPKFLRKYGKAWGAKVSTTMLDQGWSKNNEASINREKENLAYWQNELSNSPDSADFIRSQINHTEEEIRRMQATGQTVWSMSIPDSMKDSVLNEGQVLYSDRAIAPITEAETKDLEKHFGTTGNFRVAGYLLTDGKLLDFSGKHWGDTTSRMRQVDHRDVGEVLNRGNNGIDDMVDMIGSGNIRLMPEIGGINLAVYPNEKQRKVLSVYINYMLNTEGQVIIDYDAVGGDTVYSKEYGKTATSRQILSDIRNYFNGARQSDLMRFHTMYSDRSTDSFSNRSLLANALESVAQNDVERNKLNEYKSKISLIESEQAKLAEVRAKIKELSFAKGARDTEALKKLQFEENQTANRINTYDRQLLNLESTKALKGVLEREKKMAYKRAEQKGKEALKAQREKDRERNAKTQRELLTRYQESRKKGIEGRKKTEMRHKIKTVVNELYQYLEKGTKEKHVPIYLQKPVAEALDAVNMDTVGAEERIAKKREEMRIAASKGNIEKVERLSKEIEHIQEMGGNMEAKLSRLKTAYDSILNSDDPLVKNSHDAVISNTIQKVIEVVEDTPLRDMSLYQLEAVYDMYKMVLTSVRNANKAFKAAKGMEISTIANGVIAELEEQKKKSNYSTKGMQAMSAFDWNNLKPVYAFERIGSANFSKVFNAVRAGEDVWAKDMSEAQAFREEQYKKHGWKTFDLDKKYDFVDSMGKKFTLRLEQIMSIYAYSKRGEDAINHLKNGGFQFDKLTEVKEKKGKVIEVTYQLNDPTTYKLSDELLVKISSVLDEVKGAKEFVDEMQEYLSSVMGEKGNEVSLAMYEVKLFKEKNYFPLRVSKDFLERAREQAQGEVKIKNSGFTNAIKPGAKTTVVLSPFMDVWASHVNEMSMYHAFVLPLEDFYRVFNYNTPAVGNMDPMGVIPSLRGAHRDSAVEYIDQLLKDLNGGARSDPRETLGKAMMSNFKKAAVMASLSVVVQQPTAIVRATALVDAKYFVGKKATKGNHKKAWAEVKQYAPVAVIKEMGYFDTGMGKGSVEWLKGEKTFMDRVDDATSKLPALADEMTWVAIWNAVKRETLHTHKDLRPNSEEFLKAVGERFTEVVVKTQVYDSTLARSANMRSKSGLMNMWTAFMAEPTTSINMLQDAFKKGKRGKYTLRAIGAVYGSVILNAALVSLVYAMRDDDEDETFLEKYLSRLTTEVIDGVNPITYIPFFKDIWSILQGFDVERADMTLVTKLSDSLQQLVKVISTDTSDMDEEELAEHKKAVTEALLGISDNLASLVGVPVKNVRRDINGIINGYNTINEDLNGRETTEGSLGDNILEDVKDSVPIWGWLPDESKGDKLYDAIIKGDTAYVDRLKGAYKSDSAYQSAIRKALRENDPRIKEAAEARYNGNIAEYMRIAKEIIAEGRFKQDDIVAAINSEISAMKKGEGTTESSSSNKVTSIYKMDDYYAALVGRDQATAYAVKMDLIDTDVANGKDREEAEADFNSKFVSYIREQFEDGYISDYEAQDMLVQYGGRTEEGATSKIQYWDFKKKYPDYDLSEEAVTKYYSDVEPSGIGVGVYYDYYKQRSKCKGVDSNGDGKTDSGSVKREVLNVINSLPITNKQKDVLYYLNGWSASTIYEAPWH